jgi:hypothetical protein
MEERGRPGDDDNADKGQKRGKLLLSGKEFARNKPSANVAGENGGEESEDGCFCEWHVVEREIQAENAKEPKKTSSDEEGEDIAGTPGVVRDVSVISIREREDGG